jgi:hemoglobin
MNLLTRSLRAGLLAASLSTFALAAAAQNAPAPRPMSPEAAAAMARTLPPSPDGDLLYRDLGGQAVIEAVMRDFVTRVAADPRIGHFFAKTKPDALRESLVAQVCVVAGGPCRYDGGDMQAAHADMDVRRGDFNALVEVLQDSLTRTGVPFGVQNRLLARLAPMHRDIVRTP